MRTRGAPSPTVDAAAGALGTKVAAGLRWTTLAVFGNRGISWLVTLAVAKVLAPSQFGLVSIAWIAYGAAVLVRDQVVTGTVVFGLAPDDTSPTVLWVATGTSAVLGVLMVAVSPLVTDWTGHPSAALLGGLAVALMVSAVGAVPSAFLLKHMRFRLVTVAELSSTVVFAAVTLALVATLGPTAVGVGQVAGAATGTAVVVYVSRYRPRRTGERPRGRLAGYGALTVLLTLLTFCFTNLDTIAVAVSKGGDLLGVYSLAFNVAYVVTYNLGLVLGRVMFPAYSLNRHDPAGLTRMYVSTLRLVVVALVPITAVLATFVPRLIPLVFGARYDGAVGPLRWLAFYGAAAALAAVAVGLMRATGRLVPAVGVYALQICVAAVLLARLVPRQALVGAASAVTLAATVGAISLVAIGFVQLHASARPLASGAAPIVLAGGVVAGAAVVSAATLSLLVGGALTGVAVAAYGVVALRTVPETRWFRALLGRSPVPTGQAAP